MSILMVAQRLFVVLIIVSLAGACNSDGNADDFDAAVTVDASPADASIDALAAACHVTAAVPPLSIEPLPNGLADQSWTEGAALVVDLQACVAGRWFVWLPLGSAWVAVNQNGDRCELWVGGETENPNYEGAPSQHCRFLRQSMCELVIDQPGYGGPAFVDSPGCVGLTVTP